MCAYFPLFRESENRSFIERIIDNLRGESRTRKIIILEERDGICEQIRSPLPHFARDYLLKNGIVSLYSHQARAIELIRAGRDVFISTGSGSGKSLAFNIPILEHLEKNESATALYIYPLKALANDQIKVLKELVKRIQNPINPAIYDGDTPKYIRPIIRNRSRIILTNPYELHLLLPYHSQWQRFFGNLRFIVIDEAHIYRGVFGTNFAYLLRRLERVAENYGTQPIYVLSSASIGNPEEFGEKLIGRDLSVIKFDGSPKGKRYLLVWDATDNLEGKQENILAQGVKILSKSIKEGAQTILFAKTRYQVEKIYNICKRLGIDGVRAYRSGYAPQTRREIENQLKKGVARGVISTSALELGIDIGGLDVVIILGYPGTLSGFWQRAGRAGRKNQDALIIFIATDDALEQYLLYHPEILTDMEFESALIGLENPHILKGQLLCAISELSLNPSKEKFFVDNISIGLLDNLSKEGKILKMDDGTYVGTVMPHRLVNLGGLGDEQFELVVDNNVIETVELWRAYKTLFYSAVYLYQGDTYVVNDIDIDERKIKLEKVEPNYFVTPLICSEAHIVDEDVVARRYGNFTLYMGRLLIHEELIGFIIEFEGCRRVKVTLDDIERVELPIPIRPFPVKPDDFDTKGIWFDISWKVRASLGDRFPGSIHGLEHAIIGIAPLILSCDRWDLGGISLPSDARIFIYEGIKGSAGLTEKMFERFEDLLKMTKELIENCKCDYGCPSCVLSPKCGNENKPMDKRGALEIIKFIAKF